jgi:hypothetical protein
MLTVGQVVQAVLVAEPQQYQAHQTEQQEALMAEVEEAELQLAQQTHLVAQELLALSS